MNFNNLKTYNETGRSMVETLGVLAIIGVLSVGGIMGYSYGMDKYRANETVQGVFLRAVDLMTQTTQGKELSLAGWEDEKTRYPISLSEVGNNKISLQVSGMPTRVCQMVGDVMKNTAAVYVDGVDETYQGDPCGVSDTNTMLLVFDNVVSSTKCEPACDENEYCVNGYCLAGGGLPEVSKFYGECSTNDDCGVCQECDTDVNRCIYAPWSHPNGQECQLDNGSTGQCYLGECIEKGCQGNSECTGNTYCASPNTSSETDFPDGEYGACVNSDFKALDFDVNGKTEVVFVSDAILSWWDAKNICASINVDMIEVLDLVKDWSASSTGYEFELSDFGRAFFQEVLTTAVVWTGTQVNNKPCYVYQWTDGKAHVFCGGYSKNDVMTGSRLSACYDK